MSTHLREGFLSRDYGTKKQGGFGRVESSFNGELNQVGYYHQTLPALSFDKSSDMSLAGGDRLKGGAREVLETKLRALGREEHNRHLSVTVSIGEKGPGGRPLQTITLIDEHDLLFYFVLELTEQDFLVLKQEQHLNVDFQEFSKMLGEHFKCVLDSNRDEKQGFKAILDLSKEPEALFSIIELATYKNIPHLTLKLRKATDEQSKNYLARELRACREEKSKFEELYSNCREEIAEYQSNMEMLQERFRSFENDKKSKEREIQSEYEKQLHEQRSENLENERKRKDAFERELKEKCHKYEEKEKRMTDKLELLDSEVRELRDKKAELESELKDAHSKLRMLDKELTSSKRNLEITMEDNRQLQTCKITLERDNSALQARCESQQLQIQDKAKIHQLDEESRRANEDALKSKESIISERQAKIEKLERKLNEALAEIRKAKVSMDDLKADLGKKKESNKKKNEIIRQQDQEITLLKDKASELTSHSRELERGLESKDREISSLEMTIKDFKNKLEASEKSIQENQNLISYLNSQISDQKYGGGKYNFTPAQDSGSTYISNTYGKKYGATNSARSGLDANSVSLSRDNISALGGTNPDRVSSRKKPYEPANRNFDREKTSFEITGNLGLTSGKYTPKPLGSSSINRGSGGSFPTGSNFANQLGGGSPGNDFKDFNDYKGYRDARDHKDGSIKSENEPQPRSKDNIYPIDFK